MRDFSYRHSWRHVGLLSAVFVIGVFGAAIEAQAVLLYGDNARNLNAPSVAQGLAGWELQATWSDGADNQFLVTPIDATHFIAATHIGFVASTINFQGTDYTVDSTHHAWDSKSDLSIYTITSGTFPTYATLYDASIDGPETNATNMTIFGRGSQRGSAVNVDGQLRGWKWGGQDHLMSWGQNIVDGYASYDQGTTEPSLLGFYFSNDGIHNSALSTGDSSGAIFIQTADGQWKLAGINYAAFSGPFCNTSDGADPYRASLTDMRGLYVWDADKKTWVLDPTSGEVDPTASFASRISYRLDWIRENAPGVVVPEPATLVILLGAVLPAAVFGWYTRRRRAA
jgi:hypothetical protein